MQSTGQSMRMAIVTLLAIATWGTPAHADSTRESLMRDVSTGLQAYDRGTALLNSDPDSAAAAYREARDAFQAVVDAGVENGKLYYNLGNAHVRLGEIGPGIADYRRALKLTPTDEQLKANLRFARSLTRDRIQPSGATAALHTMFFWHFNIPLRQRLTLGLIAYSVFWLILIARVVIWRGGFGYAAVCALIVVLSLGISIGLELPDYNRHANGVLVADDVTVRKGNGEGYEPQFDRSLNEGVEFAVVEQRGGWIHIELPDGHTGWVRDREVELF